MPLFIADVQRSLKTAAVRSEDGLRIDQFADVPATPGNVAVCLSGGGSRAMSAGMGQLRALRHLQSGGSSLLAQTRALSTVSGGSWVGQVYSYLEGPTSDDAALNRFVADPGRLVASETVGHTLSETLDALPKGNFGRCIGSPLFSPAGLAVTAFLLWKFFRVSPDMLWQTLIGTNLLRPYGLYNPGRRFMPESLFSFDRHTLVSDVLGPNPELTEEEDMHLVAAGPLRERRPFPICNMALFVTIPGERFRFLAPVQSTPFFTGVVGTPEGVDQNGRPVGGGGVISFAFNSQPAGSNGAYFMIEQSRQWSLTDSIGTSSAFYAEMVQNLFRTWSENIEQFYENVGNLSDVLEDWLQDLLTQFRVPRMLSAPVIAGLSELNECRIQSRQQRVETTFANLGLDRGKLCERLRELAIQEIIPSYDYWSIGDPTPVTDFRSTRFADGGNLDNSGVCAALVYEDIDHLIAFANTSTRLVATDHGALDAAGNEIPGTRIMVTESLPPLFGYQPYQDGVGYQLYAGDATPTGTVYRHNQVFPSGDFPGLLQAFWRSSGNEAEPGSNRHVATARLNLEVLENPWFGIRGGKRVGILWIYNTRVRDWYDALTPQVQAIIGDFDDPESCSGFPNYSTFDTRLDATRVNLLAHLSAWAVAREQEAVLAMYQDG